jgi:hypothetical protein
MAEQTGMFIKLNIIIRAETFPAWALSTEHEVNSFAIKYIDANYSAYHSSLVNTVNMI